MKWTSAGQTVYHVTHARHVAGIKKRGLKMYGAPPNWVKQGTGETYGAGEIYAFTNRMDAIQWSTRMDWTFHEKLATGKIAIVHIDSPSGDVWEVDDHDPLAHFGARGVWIKRHENVPPAAIVKSELVRKKHLDEFKAAEEARFKNPHAAAGKVLEARAVEVFGVTEDPREAGFIMADGRMLDFSPRMHGESGGWRSADHTEIGLAFYGDDDRKLVDMPAFESGFDRVAWFQDKTGAIRFSPESCAFYIRKPLTSAQEWAVTQILDWTAYAPIVEIETNKIQKLHEFGDEEPQKIIAVIRATFRAE
jgi:hypothetical protein